MRDLLKWGSPKISNTLINSLAAEAEMNTWKWSCAKQPRADSPAMGRGCCQQVSDPGENTSCELSAHPRAVTEPLRICRAQPLSHSIISGLSSPAQINVTPAPLFFLHVKRVVGHGWALVCHSVTPRAITKGQPCWIENIYQQYVQKTFFRVIALSLYQRTQ